MKVLFFLEKNIKKFIYSDLSYKNSKESYFTLNNKNNLTDLKGNQNYACNYQNNGEVENLLPNHGIVNMPYTPTRDFFFNLNILIQKKSKFLKKIKT